MGCSYLRTIISKAFRSPLRAWATSVLSSAIEDTPPSGIDTDPGREGLAPDGFPIVNDLTVRGDLELEGPGRETDTGPDLAEDEFSLVARPLEENGPAQEPRALVDLEEDVGVIPL